jgi:plasmid stabilization system protein ParE
MKDVRFNPIAERELADAIKYYDEQKAGLGREFLEEVRRAVLFLAKYPEAAPQVRGSIRRFILPRFPYSLLYRTLETGRFRILAVAHQKRRPDYWVGRK